MPTYLFSCEAGHEVELTRVPIAERNDERACPYIYGHCEERGHPVDPTHQHTMFQCGKPLTRREAYAPAVIVAGGSSGAGTRPARSSGRKTFTVPPDSGIMEAEQKARAAGVKLVGTDVKQERAGDVLFYPKGRRKADQKQLEREGLA